MRYLVFAFSIALICLGSKLLADDAEKAAFFESKIRPVLVKHCYECHSAQSKDPKGGLLLDTREGIRRGGDSGHGVVVGEINDSLIVSAMRYESFDMPPEKPLPEEVIKDFEKWIEMGAFDPRDGKSAMIRREIDFDRAREFWSFQSIDRPIVPTVRDRGWLKNDVDAFILKRLESNGIEPAANAGASTLARRIYFDLIGMPPTPAQVKAFQSVMKQNPDAAIESLIDSLMDSRHFGERWGRHWLDVVRYAESTGMERNATFTTAWRYRDFVIKALNDDMPYDQFIREQIAGDLLPHGTLEDRNRQIIATGMLSLGPKSLNETKKEKFKMDVVDEQIDVVSRAFFGLTASCARCHDHKFDPIPQSEYYSLAGIFTSTATHYGTTKTNGNRNPGRLIALSASEVRPVAANGGSQGAKDEQKYRNQLKSLKKRLANYQKQLAAGKTQKAKAAAQKRIKETQESIRKANARLRLALQPKQNAASDSPLVMAVSDAARIAGTSLRVRGEPDERGDVVPRGFLTVASLETNPSLPSDQSGRLQLADWITRKSNPLTARVMANRVWQHLFGRGIVSTVNNFGANGDRPTHPLLLDYLASELRENGWSTKYLIRKIMTSHAYRMASEASEQGQSKDPDNKYFWRMNQRRLEAEAIRDAMLMASGELDLSSPEGSVVQKVGEGILGRNLKEGSLTLSNHPRSVYLPIVRGYVPEMLSLFDFPEPSIIGGSRNVTTVPTQALYMLNSKAVIERARSLAGRVIAEEDDSETRIQLAYELALARPASESEFQQAKEFITEASRLMQADDTKNADEIRDMAWTGFCQTLFASAEFRYVN